MPKNRSMLFSRKEFICEQMRNITVNIFGVAKLQAPGSKKQPTFSNAAPKKLKELTAKEVELVVKI